MDFSRLSRASEGSYFRGDSNTKLKKIRDKMDPTELASVASKPPKEITVDVLAEIHVNRIPLSTEDVPPEDRRVLENLVDTEEFSKRPRVPQPSSVQVAVNLRNNIKKERFRKDMNHLLGPGQVLKSLSKPSQEATPARARAIQEGALGQTINSVGSQVESTIKDSQQLKAWSGNIHDHFGKTSGKSEDQHH